MNEYENSNSAPAPRILLIMGGGIAAYKCLELIRLLRKQGCAVTTIMTAAATQFVTPLSVAALTGERVYRDLFDLTDETEMGHIELSRAADRLLVAPATADLMAKMTYGLADDLASTCLLATDKPVWIAPAMNVRMWEHPATHHNLRTLLTRGVQAVGPNEGDMACGEFGPGRMAEPDEIVTALLAGLPGADTQGTSLRGRRIIVTSGPTREPIDPVRYLANHSSGKQGHAIAAALAARGADVVLVSGPTRLPPPPCEVYRIETADEMLAQVQKALPADVFICAAAVSDWRIKDTGRHKLKKRADHTPPVLHFVENPDILATISALAGKKRPELVIGFAAETQNVIANATDKRKRKGCDWIIANDVSPERSVMGGDHNSVSLITDDGVENWKRMHKDAVAAQLAQRIAAALA